MRLAFVLLGLLLTQVAFAHAGSMKTTGSKDVMLYQSPISPLEGESVRYTFVIFKHDATVQLPNLPVTLRFVKNYVGDESKDTLLEEKEFTTDANGAFEYTRTLSDDGYYDAELVFEGSETVGFLTEVRSGERGFLWIVPFITIVAIIGYAQRNRFQKISAYTFFPSHDSR